MEILRFNNNFLTVHFDTEQLRKRKKCYKHHGNGYYSQIFAVWLFLCEECASYRFDGSTGVVKLNGWTLTET